MKFVKRLCFLSCMALSAVATADAAKEAQSRHRPQVNPLAPPWPSTQAGQPIPWAPGMPPVLARNLARFDDLDFRVYSQQRWDELHKTHTHDIKVIWPDGRVTQGLDRHIEDLKGMFAWAPDHGIAEHKVRFGTPDGTWTAVTSTLAGTFSGPMVLPDGRTIAPTGKPFNIQVVTLGHWNRRGIMFEEYLFWDNAELMRQIGVSP